jgi:hypothetical protein
MARRVLAPATVLALLAALLPAHAGAVEGFGRERGSEGFRGEYVFNFATSAGTLRSTFVGLVYDRVGDELYALSQGVVRIFSRTGMETFAFGDDPGLTGANGIAPLEDGDIIALMTRAGSWSLVRANFRGEAKGTVQITGVPATFPLNEFRPSAMRYVNGKLYLADKGGMRVLVTSAAGAYEKSYDLAEVIEAGEKRMDLGIRGFDVDRHGNLLFTISPLFRAFVLSPDGKLRGFGKAGSAPGRFGVVAGITEDDAGNVYVTDVLRCAVIVFDKNLEFLGEFGGRGFDDAGLIGPSELAVMDDTVYVLQGARRGVSVFRVKT